MGRERPAAPPLKLKKEARPQARLGLVTSRVFPWLNEPKRPGHEMAQARGSPEKEARPEAERRDAAGVESTEKRGDVKKS